MEMVKHNINCHCVKFDHQHSLCNKKMFTTNYYAPSLIQKKLQKLLRALIDSAWLFHTWACQSALDLPRLFTLHAWRLAQKAELANGDENDHHVENLRREANPCKTFLKCSSCYKTAC